MAEFVPERLPTGEYVIRASATATWSDCPRRSAARAYRGLVQSAGFALSGNRARHVGAVVGTGVHMGARVMLVEKLVHDRLPPESVYIDAAVETVREEARPGVVYDETTRTLNVAEQQAIRAARSYREHVAPEVEPVAVEERIYMPVGRRFVVTGQPDCAVPRGIRDIKGGAQSRMSGPQYGLYSMLRRFKGFETLEVIEDWLPRVSLNKDQPLPQAIRYEITVAERSAVAVTNEIMREVDAFLKTGDPYAFPSNPNSVLCSAKFCPAHGTKFCRDHAGAT